MKMESLIFSTRGEKNRERSERRPINVVTDAVVVIVIKKLRKLRSIEEGGLVLNPQLDDLILKLQRIYRFLEGQCLRESHHEWVDRLLQALYKAEDTIDVFMCRMIQREQETVRIIPDVLVTLSWQCRLHRQMKSFVNRVEGLLRDQNLHKDPSMSGSENLKETNPESQYYQRWQKVNAEGEDSAYIGDYRKNKYEKVIKRLLEEEPTALCGRAIYGDEGSGKTYLAGRVFNDSRIRNHFERKAWVHVTDSLTHKDIRYEVLKQVKAPDRVLKNREHMDEEEVKQALLKELADKRYLIVLDDFRNSDSGRWYELIRYLPDWYKGSRILVTTRSRDIAYITDYWRPIHLKNLENREDSKKLLQKKVKLEMPNLKNEDIHAKIFQASNGLPLAIALLGGLLLDSSYKEQLLQIEKVSLPDILTLSYNNLPMEEKPCFLYLTLFPKATPIPVRRILQLWLGEGLLTGSDKTSHEDVGVKYLEDLIMRNLVEVVSWKPDGTPGTCQVVTSVSDMFRPLAVELGLLYIHNRKPRDHEPSQMEPLRFKGPQFRARWVAEYSNIKSFTQSNRYLIQHMRSFLSFYTRTGTRTKDLGTFLRTVTSHNNVRLLRVLDLEGVYKPYLHDTVGRLVLLKYLGLRSTVLDTLPDPVGNLPELETLDIKTTNINFLPHSLLKSNCLRHLYLNWLYVDLSILTHYVSSGSLSNLRTLCGLYMGNISDSLVEKLVAKVTKLTKLKIHYQSSDKPDNIAKWISKLTNLHSLKLGNIKKDRALSMPNLTHMLQQHNHLFNLYLLGKLSVLEANQLPSCLRVLTLSMSELWDDPMPILGQLEHLRTLRLLAHSYTGEKMRCSKEGFPSLMVLKIWSLTELQELTMEEGCMDNLIELEVRDCAELKFESNIGLERLRSLKELILTKMPEASVTNVRMVKLPNDCLFFESGTIKEQTKEGKGEVLQKEEIEEGKRHNEAIALQQGSSQPKEEPTTSSTPTSQMDGKNKEPSIVAPTATRTGQGGANPFAL